MDWLNRWFAEQVETPLGGILLFLLVFLSRVGIDRWLQKRDTRRTKKRKEAA